MKTILFDLDGTIIDSRECIYEVYRRLFLELNLPLPSGKEFFSFIGPSVKETLAKYDIKQPQKVYARFLEIYSGMDFRKTNKVYDGIEEVLASLKERGYKLYVASTKNRRFAKEILSALELSKYFDGIYGSDINHAIVTKTDVINEIFDEHEDGREAIIIGDTVYDMKGAKESGIKMGFVKYGFGDYEEVKHDKTVIWAVSTPREIMDKI